MPFEHTPNQQDKYTGPDRRMRPDSETFNLISETREMVEKQEAEMAKQFGVIHKELRDQNAASNERHEKLGERLEHISESTLHAINLQNTTIQEIHKLFKAAFPEADAEGHRKAHESWMAKEKEDREFWLKLKQNTVNWGVIVLLGWIGLALWSAFLTGPK